jgi:hypothetical protein
MVELLNEFPPHVVAYRAKGKVTADEYRTIVMRNVDEVAKRYGKINFIVLLETDFQSYDVMAFLNYIKISFKHFMKWNRMAIVSDQKWVRTVYDLLSPLVHGKIKSYQLADQQQAREWVSAPFEKK